jgi:hypothetical protein
MNDEQMTVPAREIIDAATYRAASQEAKTRAPRSDKGKPRPMKETITVSTQMSIDDAWKFLRKWIEEGAVDDALSLTNALEAHMRSLVKAMKGAK